MTLRSGSRPNGELTLGTLSIVDSLPFVRRLGGQCRWRPGAKVVWMLERTIAPLSLYKGRTVAICFWEMVERLTHTRMGGGVWSPRGPHVGGAGGLWSEEVTCMGEGGLAWRPHSGSRRPDMRTTRPDGRGRPRPPPSTHKPSSGGSPYPAMRISQHGESGRRPSAQKSSNGSPSPDMRITLHDGSGAPRPE